MSTENNNGGEGLTDEQMKRVKEEVKRELMAEEEERRKKAKSKKCIMYWYRAKSIQLSIDFTACWFYKKGNCTRGDECPYKHNGR